MIVLRFTDKFVKWEYLGDSNERVGQSSDKR